MKVIIDTREQRPWALAGYGCEVRIAKLDTGDYAIDGDQDNFMIERKSMNDFLGTISSGWERFQREVARMSGMEHKPIIVEANLSDYCYYEQEGLIQAPEHPHTRLGPEFVAMRTAQLMRMGCIVLFAGSADLASLMGYAMLKARQVEISCN